jgi:hypothetical protein
MLSLVRTPSQRVRCPYCSDDRPSSEAREIRFE